MNNEKSLTAFIGHITSAREMITEITAALENHCDVHPDDVNWGNVGDIARTSSALKEIRDQLLGLGEYAV